jgi:hypothetical protein
MNIPIKRSDRARYKKAISAILRKSLYRNRFDCFADDKEHIYVEQCKLLSNLKWLLTDRQRKLMIPTL